MNRLIPFTCLALAACTPPPPIIEYDVPLPGKGVVLEYPPASPPSNLVFCPPTSPRRLLQVPPGHEDSLCWPEDQTEPRQSEPTPPPPPPFCEVRDFLEGEER